MKANQLVFVLVVLEFTVPCQPGYNPNFFQYHVLYSYCFLLERSLKDLCDNANKKCDKKLVIIKSALMA